MCPIPDLRIQKYIEILSSSQGQFQNALINTCCFGQIFQNQILHITINIFYQPREGSTRHCVLQSRTCAIANQSWLWPNKPILDRQSSASLLHTTSDGCDWRAAAAAFLPSFLFTRSVRFCSAVVIRVGTNSSPGIVICRCLLPSFLANISGLQITSM